MRPLAWPLTRGKQCCSHIFDESAVSLAAEWLMIAAAPRPTRAARPYCLSWRHSTRPSCAASRCSQTSACIPVHGRECTVRRAAAAAEDQACQAAWVGTVRQYLGSRAGRREASGLAPGSEPLSALSTFQGHAHGRPLSTENASPTVGLVKFIPWYKL